jgi:hypothetical protein
MGGHGHKVACQKLPIHIYSETTLRNYLYTYTQKLPIHIYSETTDSETTDL